MRTTYNKLNNHALVFIEITKAWLFFKFNVNSMLMKGEIFVKKLTYKFNYITKDILIYGIINMTLL